jgi:hypothetical protein
LGHAVRTIQEFVRTATPASFSGTDALAVVDILADAEKAAASGIALFTPVVGATGSYAKRGHGSAADWLGSVAGTSAGAAKSRLAAAERATANPALTEALHSSGLSTAQLGVVGSSSASAAGAVDKLLELTERGASHQELTDTATRLAANARSRETERARRDRIQLLRNFRVHQCPEGGVRGQFFCDDVAWARVYPALEADAKARWKAAGMVEPLDAYRCDAFLAQLGGTGYGDDGGYFGDGDGSGDGGGGGGGTDGGGPGGGGRGANRTARPHTLVIIDAEALRRGTTDEGEICEIEGIGPVSVEAATELLGEGSVQFIVRDGVDIRTVTSTSRTIPQRVGAALVVRDRSCAAGCGKRHGLEGDHRVVDFGDHGPTELDNLARLCASCHDLKTYGGWRLEGSAGKWKWVAPAHPKSAFYIARARQLAAARAKAMAEAKRNDPLRQ